jgi:hypothetical protein
MSEKTGRKVQHGNCRRGQKPSKEWYVWNHIKRRCTNPNYTYYKNYGGRGIKVCDRWFNSFENFFEDMGLAPSPKHQIDRIDNDGNYEPANCRWVTCLENSWNRSSNTVIEYNGEKKSLLTLANDFGISRKLLGDRIRRGWPVEAALTAKKGFKYMASNSHSSSPNSIEQGDLDFIVSALNYLFHRTYDRLQSGEALGDIERSALLHGKKRSEELIEKLLNKQSQNRSNSTDKITVRDVENHSPEKKFKDYDKK